MVGEQELGSGFHLFWLVGWTCWRALQLRYLSQRHDADSMTKEYPKTFCEQDTQIVISGDVLQGHLRAPWSFIDVFNRFLWFSIVQSRVAL